MISREETIIDMMRALRLYFANDTCMTVEECASFLRVHKNTVLNKIHSKDIQAKFVGRWSIPKLQFLQEIVGPDMQ